MTWTDSDLSRTGWILTCISSLSVSTSVHCGRHYCYCHHMSWLSSFRCRCRRRRRRRHRHPHHHHHHHHHPRRRRRRRRRHRHRVIIIYLTILSKSMAQLSKPGIWVLPSLKLTTRPWKSIVGRWVSFWGPASWQVQTASFGEGFCIFWLVVSSWSSPIPYTHGWSTYPHVRYPHDK